LQKFLDTARPVAQNAIAHADHRQIPVRNLQFWIETNVLLILKGAPFDKRDVQLVSTAGSCADCPKRTGHNKLLFGDDLGKQGDQALQRIGIDAGITELMCGARGRGKPSTIIPRCSEASRTVLRAVVFPTPALPCKP